MANKEKLKSPMKMKVAKVRQRKRLGMNPTFSSTCVMCRRPICSQINVSGPNEVETLRLKILSLESLFTLFGTPEEHPFLRMFLNCVGGEAKLCRQCTQDVYDTHYTFWQLHNLERKLIKCQKVLYQRLKSNYDLIPVATLFSQLRANDVLDNFDKVTFDEIVKVLFEAFKEKKEEWPTSNYISKWKRIEKNAVSANILQPAPTDNNSDSVEQHKIRSDINVVKNETDLLETDHPIINPPQSLISGDLPDEELTSIHAEESPNIAVEINEDNFDSLDEYPNRSPAHCQEDYYDDANDSTWCIANERKGKKKYKIRGSNKTKSKRGRKKTALSIKLSKVPLKLKLKDSFECKEEPAVCNEVCDSKKELNIHIKTSHRKVTKLACQHDGCKLQFKTESSLEAHRNRTHLKFDSKNAEVCDICGTKVPKGELKKHYFVRHVGVGKFSCELCSMDFNDQEELNNHELLHQNAKLPFICVVCETIFTNTLDLRTHVSNNHMSSGLKCDKCGIMKPNEFLLQRHMKIHERELTFVCECGKSFGTKGHLNYHKHHHHVNAGKTYPCEICGKTFLYLKNATRHLVTHQEDKPFKCKICPKMFNYSHLLKKHEEIHSGTKNYSCEVCGKRFRQEQNLKQHMRTHQPKPTKAKQPVEKKARKKYNKKPKKKVEESSESVPIPIPPSSIKDEDILPVILNVQGSEEDPLKVLQSQGIETQDPVAATTVTFALPEACGSEQFETVEALGQVHEIREIQIADPSNLDQTTTTTVVFLTADNFQWLA